MQVRVFLRSGAERIVETADAARANGPFFEITRRYGEGKSEIVLTLRAQDVVGAEVVNGTVTNYVAGGAEQ